MGALAGRVLARGAFALALAGGLVACGESGESTVQDEVGRADSVVETLQPKIILHDIDPVLRDAFRMAKRRRFNKSQELVGKYLRKAGPKASHVHARFVQAVAYLNLDHNEQARQLFEWVIERRPDYVDVQHYYGYCLYYLGDLDGARGAFETYLHHVPDQSASHHGLGLIALQEGRTEEARRNFERAIGLSQDDASEQLALSHTRLGDVYMQTDCLMDARRSYSKAVEVWPGLEEAWYALHRALIRLGEERQAQEALDEHTRLVARGGPARGNGNGR